MLPSVKNIKMASHSHAWMAAMTTTRQNSMQLVKRYPPLNSEMWTLRSVRNELDYQTPCQRRRCDDQMHCCRSRQTLALVASLLAEWASEGVTPR